MNVEDPVRRGLGDWHGTTLPRIPEAIVERHPWLERFRQRSATELEIRHAVLEGGRPAVRAMFYFRRSGKARHGGKTKIEAADAGENPERLLEGLKEEIRRGRFPVREDYTDVGTLENWLLDDLWQAIREDFPEAPALSPLEQQRREQVAFAASRTRNYAARDGDFERVDRAGRGADPCLMVTGEAGIGKSALLANWMERFRKHQGLFNQIKSLTHTAESYPISATKTISHYGYNARRINYKKMAIVYTVHGKTVLIHRVLPSALISGL